MKNKANTEHTMRQKKCKHAYIYEKHEYHLPRIRNIISFTTGRIAWIKLCHPSSCHEFLRVGINSSEDAMS